MLTISARDNENKVEKERGKNKGKKKKRGDTNYSESVRAK